MEFLSEDFGGTYVEAADHAMFQASGLVLYSEPASNISLNDGEYESQLHTLEKSAYTAVLRAFCAQSNALSWGKEELITELRKELRVSDVEHRHILALISSDKSIKLLRGSRKQSESQVVQEADHRNYDVIHVGPKKKKLKAAPHSALAPIPDCISPPAQAQLAIKAAPSLLKNKKVDKVRGTGGPFSAQPRMHAPPAPVASVFEQIRYNAPTPAPTCTTKPVQRASQSISQQLLSKKRISDAIHIRPTDMLIRQIKEACSNGNSDSVVVEKARQLLKDQEKALMEAIGKLGNVSDSGEPFLIGSES
ncbi:Protein EMSY-LIKE 1 [Carex littledalei]|uniref:Protein EMSY-LIKE 1 n=1 Tax=Carex littledalei TaxID=544730 RepID=A0A833QJ58_9POAL|nr:Protein EMSY-LIKE 1 [Carex littledalei]